MLVLSLLSALADTADVKSAGAALYEAANRAVPKQPNLAPFPRRLWWVLHEVRPLRAAVMSWLILVRTEAEAEDNYYIDAMGWQNLLRDANQVLGIGDVESKVIKLFSDYTTTGKTYTNRVGIPATSRYEPLVNYVAATVQKILNGEYAPYSKFVSSHSLIELDPALVPEAARAVEIGFDQTYPLKKKVSSKYTVHNIGYKDIDFDPAVLNAIDRNRYAVTMKYVYDDNLDITHIRILGYRILKTQVKVALTEQSYGPVFSTHWHLNPITRSGTPEDMPLGEAIAEVCIGEEIRQFRAAIGTIRDWQAAGEAGDLMKLPWRTALRRAQAWHRELARLLPAPLRSTNLIPNAGAIVATLEGGWTIHRLEASQLKEESAAMKHCVGIVEDYAIAVRTGKAKIYSVRNERGEPFFTIEARLNYVKREEQDGIDMWFTVVQVKGEGDRIPGLTKEKAKTIRGDSDEDFAAKVERAKKPFIYEQDAAIAAAALKALQTTEGVVVERRTYDLVVLRYLKLV